MGNSGQGKSYLLKLLLTNIRESGKSIICLDPESEYEEICSALGGCYIDFMSGEYTINPLEPKAWNDGTDAADPDAPDGIVILREGRLEADAVRRAVREEARHGGTAGQ